MRQDLSVRSADVALDLMERIRVAIRRRGMNLREVAEKAGVPYSSLNAYLAHRHAMPAPILARIARAIEVDANWLLFEREFILDQQALRRALDIYEILSRASQKPADLAATVAAFYAHTLHEAYLPRGDAGVVTFESDLPTSKGGADR